MPSNRYYPQLLYVCRVYAEKKMDVVVRAMERFREERDMEYDNVKMEMHISSAIDLYSSEYERLCLYLFPSKVGKNKLYVAHIYKIRN